MIRCLFIDACTHVANTNNCLPTHTIVRSFWHPSHSTPALCWCLRSIGGAVPNEWGGGRATGRDSKGQITVVIVAIGSPPRAKGLTSPHHAAPLLSSPLLSSPPPPLPVPAGGGGGYCC